MAESAQDLAQSIAALVRDLGGAARGFAHHRLPDLHHALAQAVAAFAAERPPPSLAREVRERIEGHQRVLLSLNETIGRALREAQHVPALCYGQSGRMAAGAPRAMVSTKA